MRSKPIREHAEFVDQWNRTDATERRQIRRLVRIGRPGETKAQAQLAVQFGEFQRARPWYRYYWFWFVPAVLIALVASLGIHPILVGIVLGGAASAIAVRRNFKRVAKINGPLLAS